MISDDSHMSIDQSPMKIEERKQTSIFSQSWVEMFEESNERREKEHKLSGLGELISPESLIDENAQLDLVRND